ncbi:MAG: M24 family metallopeptidase [Spirochaetales bacterium]|jgi:Xaa-Pro aminopeptidase|nr:M24 family metallopeptidase [Spirochaetales bacterium]
MNRLEESAYKVNRIRALLDKTGYDGVIIRKQPNFSWVTAGGRPFIGLATETACAAVVVTKDSVYLAGNNIEVPRLIAEELPQGFAEPAALPWQEDGGIDKLLSGRFGKLTTDTEQDPWFKEERMTLLDSEIERYAKLGAASASALEEVCASLKPGTTELETAGKISEQLWAAGIEPITPLIAADDRSNTVRHYVPTAKKIQSGVICSICARSGGLVVSATRVVAFKKEFALNYGKLLNVEQAAFEGTRDGAVLGNVLQQIMDAYKANGLPDEWNNHHQGGLAGYLAREIRVGPGCPVIARTGQAFAWNPSAVGAKCEDTILLAKDGLRVLTKSTPSWPTVKAGNFIRPDILRK